MKLLQLIEVYRDQHVPTIIDQQAVCRILNILSLELGSIEVTKLTRKDLLDYRTRRNLASSTVNRELRIFSAVMNYAKDNCIIDDFSISVPMSKEKSKTDYLTEDKVILLIKNSPNDICKDFISLLYLTAQRFTAVQTLQWSQIHDGIIYFNDVQTSYSERMKRRGTVASTEAVMGILARCRLRNGHSKYVFPDTRGGEGFCKTLRAWFETAAENAGLDITPHGIRHSSASNALSKGASIHEISTLLGHSNVAITQKVYLHSDPASTKKTSNLLTLGTTA